MSRIVVNKSPFDQFTLVHAGAGVAARHYGFSFCQTLAAGFLWDYAIEPAAKAACQECCPHPSQDSPKHQLIDALTPAVAWLLADWYLAWKQR